MLTTAEARSPAVLMRTWRSASPGFYFLDKQQAQMHIPIPYFKLPCIHPFVEVARIVLQIGF
jgi:hypothetical protein